jgi:hypothetical protein
MANALRRGSRSFSDGDDLIEPPVPPELGHLSAPLRACVEFFEIDRDLVTLRPPLVQLSKSLSGARGAVGAGSHGAAATAPQRAFSALADQDS